MRRCLRFRGSLRFFFGATLIWVSIQPQSWAQAIANPANSVTSTNPTSSVNRANPALATESPQILVGDRSPLPLQNMGFYPIFAPPELPPLQPMLPEAAPEVRLVIRRSDRRVYVYHDDTVVETFPIAVGREGWETPLGSYAVLSKIENPGWTNPFTGEVIPPGPDNPLGERWIGFWTDGNNYIGFHGTPNRESVGRAASHGCIRMYNENVRRLYDMVELGTPVMVEP
jgi:L,D-transpeptidase ErfK/SrfK